MNLPEFLPDFLFIKMLFTGINELIILFLKLQIIKINA